MIQSEKFPLSRENDRVYLDNTCTGSLSFPALSPLLFKDHKNYISIPSSVIRCHKPAKSESFSAAYIIYNLP